MTDNKIDKHGPDETLTLVSASVRQDPNSAVPDAHRRVSCSFFEV